MSGPQKLLAFATELSDDFSKTQELDSKDQFSFGATMSGVNRNTPSGSQRAVTGICSGLRTGRNEKKFWGQIWHQLFCMKIGTLSLISDSAV